MSEETSLDMNCDYCGGWKFWATSKSGAKYLRPHTKSECAQKKANDVAKTIARIADLEKTLFAYESVNLSQLNEEGAKLVEDVKQRLEQAKKLQASTIA